MLTGKSIANMLIDAAFIPIIVTKGTLFHCQPRIPFSDPKPDTSSSDSEINDEETRYIQVKIKVSLITLPGGVLSSPFPSRSQARIKEEGWCMVPAGRKNSRQTYMTDNARIKYNARKSPSSNRPRPRPNVPVCEGLPQQR